MFRETIQVLACLALLTSANSLHMARDAFHRPTSDLGIVDFIDDTSDEIQSQHEQQQQQQQHQQTPLEQSSPTGSNYHNRRGSYTVHDQQINLSPNSIDQFARSPSMRDRQDTPRALQELFAGPSTLDIRLEQQKQSLQQQEQQHQNKRASITTTNTGGEGGSGGSATPVSSGKHILPQVSHGIASQLMLRSARGQRNYDVPQIECPPAMDGMERFACPSPDRQGRYRCIDDHVLCDGFIDCPEGEDEERQACMFYKTTKAHLDVLADALLRWARGR
ncbi:uncharacterized protein LOC119072602 [Bradysia coprophila]|uniref:uncharacterized protein LOC119072602 n=1 Tax=Bradysia coprophila TaxID=38358 RepID=UPI00187D92A0|nr:uncharacterized protein LOC119072602 [Bradysia coprophila]